MISALKAFFWIVFLSMIAITTWASLHENVVSALVRFARDPWALATLADAYFGFLAFWLWIVHRESCWPTRLIWLVAILFLGNLAMAGYALLQLHRLPPGATVADLLRRRTS